MEMARCEMLPRLLAGVGELYEPVADEKGIELRVNAPFPAPIHGNRDSSARRWPIWWTTP